ncbi:MAG: hypothetical protein Greene041662_810 [Candidatus Peregrinibacteria bacterium Greene0416_62]|nr:MAG: hypothetical protein Greene041662_810 [Candidatus Peregrinibacteria bacterium Greene0416_62]TSC96988.1 MAG: hypothetical protein Greene101449_1356 [Candidatus Peregrinibacteria bacterium Greene1014_49]
MDFDCIIFSIADPAGNAECVGLLLRGGAKEDAVNGAGNDDPKRGHVLLLPHLREVQLHRRLAIEDQYHHGELALVHVD